MLIIFVYNIVQYIMFYLVHNYYYHYNIIMHGITFVIVIYSNFNYIIISLIN